LASKSAHKWSVFHTKISVHLRESAVKTVFLFLVFAVAASLAGAAVAWFGQFAVGADTGLGVAAPEQAIVTCWNVGIRV
jgi:hypothetical protein